MKKFLVVLIVALTTGCAGMHGSGYSSGNGTGGTGASGVDNDSIYRPNLNPVFKGMDSSFQPYFGD